ncbi:putative quinol monooxygenase [Kitasatospora sp. NPDC096147]|uniref:putative quinol monooxygenase n=1 Tax=Kitasatospora sp. NPDC096147 TaxID=3364093 RepID=UPI003802D59E
MLLTALVRYQARTGQQDRLRTELEALLEPAAEWPGCLAYELYVDPNRPERMAVFEEWSCLDGWRLHRHRAAGRTAALLARPVAVRLYYAGCEGVT